MVAGRLLRSGLNVPGLVRSLRMRSARSKGLPDAVAHDPREP